MKYRSDNQGFDLQEIIKQDLVVLTILMLAILAAYTSIYPKESYDNNCEYSLDLIRMFFLASALLLTGRIYQIICKAGPTLDNLSVISGPMFFALILSNLGDMPVEICSATSAMSDFCS